MDELINTTFSNDSISISFLPYLHFSSLNVYDPLLSMNGSYGVERGFDEGDSMVTSPTHC